MLDLKYIIVHPSIRGTNNQPDGPPVAILFPKQNKITHRDVASLHSASRHPVRGAGFCRISPNGTDWTVEVYGRSETLERESKPEDAEAILMLLRGQHDPY